YTTPSKNAFITAINVVIVPFIGYLIYKRKLDGISIVSSIIAIVGIGILSLDANLSLNRGDFLTLICAVGFAMHIFFTGEFAKEHDPIVLTTVQLITAFILSAVLLIFTRESDIIISIKGMGAVSYLAVFSTTIAFLLQTICQRKTTQSETAIILSTEAIFGTILSAIILHEVITLKMIIGSSLIFFSIIMAETKLSFLIKNKKEKKDEKIETEC
ncbi:MAG: DMT family transporter, partial [Peptostreptococcaceae bacterium]